MIFFVLTSNYRPVSNVLTEKMNSYYIIKAISLLIIWVKHGIQGQWRLEINSHAPNDLPSFGFPEVQNSTLLTDRTLTPGFLVC